MTPQEKARRLRPIIEKAAASLTDKEASEAVELVPHYPYDGSITIAAGTRINWDGMLYAAKVTLYAFEHYDLYNAPDLWQEVMYRDGIRVIPEQISVTELFSKGEFGWWKNSLYESKLDANNWTPEQHPDGWKLIRSDEQ